MDGKGLSKIRTDRVRVCEIFDRDGATLLIHEKPDTHANTPERYLDEDEGAGMSRTIPPFRRTAHEESRTRNHTHGELRPDEPGCSRVIPSMRRSLDFLPQDKQNTLHAITKMIRDAVDVEMIILFGSFARDTYVEDASRGYFSDYDVRSVSHKCHMRDVHGKGWEQG